MSLGIEAFKAQVRKFKGSMFNIGGKQISLNSSASLFKATIKNVLPPKLDTPREYPQNLADLVKNSIFPIVEEKYQQPCPYRQQCKKLGLIELLEPAECRIMNREKAKVFHMLSIKYIMPGFEWSMTHEPLGGCFKRYGRWFYLLNERELCTANDEPLDLLEDINECHSPETPPESQLTAHNELMERTTIQIVSPKKIPFQYFPVCTVHYHELNSAMTDSRIGNLVTSMMLRMIWCAYSKDYDKPLASYGIVTNGKQFTLVGCQLNTLDFDNNSNPLNNRIWYKSMDLYSGTPEEAHHDASLINTEVVKCIANMNAKNWEKMRIRIFQ